MEAVLKTIGKKTLKVCVSFSLKLRNCKEKTFQKQPVSPGIDPLEMYNTVLTNVPKLHHQKFNEILLKVQKSCKTGFRRKTFPFRLIPSLHIQRAALKALSKAKRQKLKKYLLNIRKT